MKALYKKLVRRSQIEMKNVYQKKCLLTCKNSTEAFSHAAKKSWQRFLPSQMGSEEKWPGQIHEIFGRDSRSTSKPCCYSRKRRIFILKTSVLKTIYAWSKSNRRYRGVLEILAMHTLNCRTSSYLQTMANERSNPLIAIQMALFKDIGAGE